MKPLLYTRDMKSNTTRFPEARIAMRDAVISIDDMIECAMRYLDFGFTNVGVEVAVPRSDEMSLVHAYGTDIEAMKQDVLMVNDARRGPICVVAVVEATA